MNATSAPAVAHIAEPVSEPLIARGPRTPALAGNPVESLLVLHADANGRSGIWECTPGRFESARHGDNEMMHFVAGEGTITSADGSVHQIRPGVILVVADGWRGTWDIRETVRKTYTIWVSPASSMKTGQAS